MNSFTKGLLTGVFGVVVGLLISGSKNQDGQVGTYQISTTTDSDEYNYIYETIIDTRSGEVVYRQSAETSFSDNLYPTLKKGKFRTIREQDAEQERLEGH